MELELDKQEDKATKGTKLGKSFVVLVPFCGEPHASSNPTTNRITPAPRITQNGLGRNRTNVKIAISMMDTPTHE
jgi:hypothetical protein